MSLGSVVFFEHQIAASLFEKNFHKVRCVRVVIDNKDAPFSFLPETPIERGQEKSALVPRGRKSAVDYSVHTLSSTFLAGCLGRRQPGDKPGAEESEHYPN